MYAVAVLLASVPGVWTAGGSAEGDAHSGFARVNGARLYYEVKRPVAPMDGASDGVPVVLVHGLSLDRRMWHEQFDALARHFVTYRLDLRGHGRSDAATGPVALHDDVLGFMDAMGIRRAHLIGQSLGGNAATEVAASSPDRVETLVLIDAGINGFAYPTPNILQRIPRYLEIFATDGREAALDAWLRDPLFAVSREQDEVRQALERVVLECPCSLYFNPQYQVRPPTFTRLSRIVAPTLLMIGERDTPDFQAATDALERAIDGSVKVVIPGAGHMANMDQPAVVTGQLLRFLREHARR
jgi:pimeloyl-ACP methyl ester carboxylesterase